jgi:glycosyltransferase involved in cell wall biosynthesis
MYVNTPINRKTYYAKEKNAGISRHCDIIRDHEGSLRPVQENLWEFYPESIVESINWLPSTRIFRAINSINNKRFASDINKAVKKLGFNNIILFNDNDFFNGYNLKKLLNSSAYLYYCRDYLRGFSYWKKHGDALEPAMIAKADAALANSLYLRDYCASFNPRSYYIGQGCNLELFDAQKKYAKPVELKNISSPIIGYVGALTTERLDIGVIELIAKARTNWNLLLVGPEDEAFQKSSLHDLPNVHFTGRKPLEELPAYVNGFDVCINPQLINEITIGNYPLKVDEYLAMGKPVVATATKTMDLFAEHTYLAQRPEEYPVLIEKAWKENNEVLAQKRIAFAHTHTWENCMKAIGRVVMEMNS